MWYTIRQRLYGVLCGVTGTHTRRPLPIVTSALTLLYNHLPLFITAIVCTRRPTTNHVHRLCFTDTYRHFHCPFRSIYLLHNRSSLVAFLTRWTLTLPVFLVSKFILVELHIIIVVKCWPNLVKLTSSFLLSPEQWTDTSLDSSTYVHSVYLIES